MHRRGRFRYGVQVFVAYMVVSIAILLSIGGVAYLVEAVT
jgi:hypothetical protein